jgi:hypothetical protein
MDTIFDSILLNSLQMESGSSEVTLDCTVYEAGTNYDTQLVLSSTGMNRLLSELSFRDIELDFDGGCSMIALPDGTIVSHMDLRSAFEKPVFVPLYIMPENLRALRA